MEMAITLRGKEIADDLFVSEPASDESGDFQHCRAVWQTKMRMKNQQRAKQNLAMLKVLVLNDKCNCSRVHNALLREVCAIIAHLFIVTTITDILQWIMWSDDEHPEDPIKSRHWSYLF